MTARRQPAIDEELRALAHPSRRRVVQLCLAAERSVGELAGATRLSQPTVSRHLKVLRDAGLVQARIEGNRRLYRVDFARLARLRAVLDAFWGDGLARLRDAAERDAARRTQR